MPLYNPAPPTWGLQSTRWYHAQGAAGLTVLQTKDVLTYAPMLIPVPAVFDRIGLEVTVAAASSSYTRLGIYADVNGFPGPLILDAGTIPTSCAAGTSTIAITQALGPGTVWVAGVSQVQAGTQPTERTYHSENILVGMSTVLDQWDSGWQQTNVTGALPASATPATAIGNAAAVMLRAQ